MAQQEPTEYILDVFADPRSVGDIVRGASLPVAIAKCTRQSMPRPRHPRLIHPIYQPTTLPLDGLRS